MLCCAVGSVAVRDREIQIKIQQSYANARYVAMGADGACGRGTVTARCNCTAESFRERLLALVASGERQSQEYPVFVSSRAGLRTPPFGRNSLFEGSTACLGRRPSAVRTTCCRWLGVEEKAEPTRAHSSGAERWCRPLFALLYMVPSRRDPSSWKKAHRVKEGQKVRRAPAVGRGRSGGSGALIGVERAYSSCWSRGRLFLASVSSCILQEG